MVVRYELLPADKIEEVEELIEGNRNTGVKAWLCRRWNK